MADAVKDPGAGGRDTSRLRALPSVGALLERPDMRALTGVMGHTLVAAALRDVLRDLRALADGTLPSADTIAARVAEVLAARTRPVLHRVINATGIILHTNLGRAPLAEAAIEAAADAARGYANLEFDLARGARGARLQGIEPKLRALTGAEAGIAVNNNAAAVMLVLTALAAGGEVIISRGELVEIGGGFRVPDIIRSGGARLIEVGTTNRTRLADYAAAIGPETRLLLKVHQSNFRIVGFTETVPIAALAGLARERGVPLVEDLGSGMLLDLTRYGRSPEPTVGASIAAGADLVCFSGDKLLGGPQAGIVVGRTGLVDTLRHHPLMRALRLDKMTLAALEATLALYRDPAIAEARVPVIRMLAQTEATLRTRAEALAAQIRELIGAEVVRSSGRAGGGALPEEDIPSFSVAVSLPGQTSAEIAARLRDGDPPIVGRVADGHLALDVLTLDDADLPVIARALCAAAQAR